MLLSVLRGGNRKSDRDAGQGLFGGGASPFSPVRSSTASVKLLPKNAMTKSTGPPPLLWLWRYHLLPRTVKLSCRFQRYSCPARVSCSPCDCRKETRSAWLARSICSWSYVKKKYKLNVNSTLIFLIILFQFQVFSILSSIFSHVHSAIRNCSDYESLLYYKMFLYTQIQVCTHAYNP